MGFGVRFWVWGFLVGLGFLVECFGIWSRVSGLGFRILLSVLGLGFWDLAKVLGFRVSGFGLGFWV